MDAYYSGREVLPALQLRALPSPAYKGFFALRPTGTAFQFQVIDGRLPPAERLASPAGTVVCTRPYVPATEGNGNAAPRIRILRLKLQIPAQNLTLPQSGFYYVYLKLRVQKGNDAAIGHWNDPELGNACFAAQYVVSSTRLDPASGQDHGHALDLLIGSVSSDSQGALTIVQQLHGEPDVVMAAGERQEESSSSGSASESVSVSESVVEPSVSESVSKSRSVSESVVEQSKSSSSVYPSGSGVLPGDDSKSKSQSSSSDPFIPIEPSTSSSKSSSKSKSKSCSVSESVVEQSKSSSSICPSGSDPFIPMESSSGASKSKSKSKSTSKSTSDVYPSGSGTPVGPSKSTSKSGGGGGGGGGSKSRSSSNRSSSSSARSSSSSYFISSSGEVYGIDGLFYRCDVTVFDAPGGGRAGAAQIDSLGEMILQAPFAEFHNYYDGQGRFVFSIGRYPLSDVGYETYAEAEEHLYE